MADGEHPSTSCKSNEWEFAAPTDSTDRVCHVAETCCDETGIATLHHFSTNTQCYTREAAHGTTGVVHKVASPIIRKVSQHHDADGDFTTTCSHVHCNTVSEKCCSGCCEKLDEMAQNRLDKEAAIAAFNVAKEHYDTSPDIQGAKSRTAEIDLELVEARAAAGSAQPISTARVLAKAPLVTEALLFFWTCGGKG